MEDARSFSGIETFTDHRLVKAKINIKWYQMQNTKKTPKLNLDKLRDTEYRQKYKKIVEVKLEKGKTRNVQERWTNIAETCVKAAEEVVGRKQSEKKSGNKEIEELSQKQKSIRNDMNATNTKKGKEKLHKQRNKALKEIHSKLKEEEEKKIREMVEEIEKYKDDSRKMFQAIKQLQRRKEKKKVVLDSVDGKTTNEKRQVEIVTKFFEEMFTKKSEQEKESIQPKKMAKPFTTKEIKDAIKSLKNGKSAGIALHRIFYLQCIYKYCKFHENTVFDIT